MTPMIPQEINPRQSEDLREAQVHAGAWTALLAAMVSLMAMQASVGTVPSLAATTLFTAVAGGIYRGWAWTAALGCIALVAMSIAFAAGLLPVAPAARIPVSLLGGAGALCLAGAYLTLTEERSV
jgi:cell division protein FtsW (lipid II flippase)